MLLKLPDSIILFYLLYIETILLIKKLIVKHKKNVISVLETPICYADNAALYICVRRLYARKRPWLRLSPYSSFHVNSSLQRPAYTCRAALRWRYGFAVGAPYSPYNALRRYVRDGKKACDGFLFAYVRHGNL